MRLVLVTFVAGAALLQVQPALPERDVVAGFAIVAVLLIVLRRRWASTCAGVLFGACWAALLAHAALADQLAPADEGIDITVAGVIDSLPYKFDRGVRFNFLVEQARGASGPVPPKIALAWYDGYRDVRQAVGDLQPGERWQLTVRLQRPHGNSNPHGFDYEVWLLEQGVRATGYVRPAGAENRRLDAFVFGASNLVEHCRATLRERILRALLDKKYAGVVVALVVGDQRAIAQSDWKVFNRTGVGHLISISGL